MEDKIREQERRILLNATGTRPPDKNIYREITGSI
jgi:hypothetical protein